MSPEQYSYMVLLVGVYGYSVTFGACDPLNPQCGLQVIIEGPFGKVSGDSQDSLSEAFFRASEQLKLYNQGFASNVQPHKSLVEQVKALPASGLESVLSAIEAETYRRATADLAGLDFGV